MKNNHNGPCISLYTDELLPAANPKAGLKRAKEMLRDVKTSFDGTSMTVEEAETLLDSNWHQGFESERLDAKGTAIFVSRSFFGKCQVPVAVAEKAVVGKEFLVRPLLPSISRHSPPLETYKELVNTPLTSSNLRKIIAAAERGIVRFLFLPPTGEQWGSFESPETVHIREKAEPGDEELLNLAAIFALRHGGQVWVVPNNELRAGSEIAAVFRF